MANDAKLEVPPELRTIAEQGVDQARAAIDGFLNAAHKALDDAGRQVDAAHDQARDLGRTALQFAEDNIAAGFDFAAQLAKATTVDDWTRLHADYVKHQAARLAEQAKTLGSQAMPAAVQTPGNPFAAAPAADAPVHETPAPDAPTHDAPGHEHSGNENPGHENPGHDGHGSEHHS